MKNAKFILIACLFLASFKSFAQDIAQQLTGGNSHTWELREIKWIDNRDLKSEEFSEDAEFTLNTELGQMLPETIVFNFNGSCDLLYSSYYDASGQLVAAPKILLGSWSVVGTDVKILEPNGDGVIDENMGSAWWLKNVTINGKTIACNYDLYGYDDGIRGLEYEMEK